MTSYYKERFGFCMSENEKNKLKPGKYHVYIDSELFDGALTYADIVFRERLRRKFFFRHIAVIRLWVMITVRGWLCRLNWQDA